MTKNNNSEIQNHFKCIHVNYRNANKLIQKKILIK